MHRVEKFTIEENKCRLAWEFKGEIYYKSYLHAINCAIVLRDETGIVVVGSYNEFGMSNAFIINADGSLRTCIKIPKDIKKMICFHEIYYANRELTGVIACIDRDYSCIIDDMSGDCRGLHETR
jgi:hypothetical protein